MSVSSIPVIEMPHTVQMGGRRRIRRRNRSRNRRGGDDDETLRLMEEGELTPGRLAEEGRSPTPPTLPLQLIKPTPLSDPTDIVIDIDKAGGSRRRNRRSVKSHMTRKMKRGRTHKRYNRNTRMKRKRSNKRR